MIEEPTLKLFALALVAARTIDDRAEIGVRSTVALLTPETSIEESGLSIARHLLPEAEGWQNHFASATEIIQDFPLEPFRLTWQVEKSE